MPRAPGVFFEGGIHHVYNSASSHPPNGTRPTDTENDRMYEPGIFMLRFSPQINERRDGRSAMRVNRRRWLQLAGGAVAAGVLPSAARGGEAPTASATPEPVIDTANAWIDVDLQRLALNLQSVRKHVQGRKVMAVVKANAYGHGLPQVGAHLAECGADALMVIDLAEAMSLRDAGVECMILNFGAVPEHSYSTLIENRISQAVFSEEIEGLSAAAKRLGKKALVHLHVDTGLGRLGVPFRHAHAYVERLAGLDGLKIEGVMTTLAEHGEFDHLQVQRLEELFAWARERGIDLGLRHAVSTGGLLSAGKELWLDTLSAALLDHDESLPSSN